MLSSKQFSKHFTSKAATVSTCRTFAIKKNQGQATQPAKQSSKADPLSVDEIHSTDGTQPDAAQPKHPDARKGQAYVYGKSNVGKKSFSTKSSANNIKSDYVSGQEDIGKDVSYHGIESKRQQSHEGESKFDVQQEMQKDEARKSKIELK